MSQFGRAVNAGAGARAGLPLGAPDARLPWYWRVAVERLVVQGLPAGATFNVRMEVVNCAHTLPAKQLANLDAKGGGGGGALVWQPEDAQGQQQQQQEGQQQQQDGHQQEGQQQQQQQPGQQSPLGGGVSFWPLPPELKGAELCVQLFSRGKRLLAVGRIPLGQLAAAANAAAAAGNDAELPAQAFSVVLVPVAPPSRGILHLPASKALRARRVSHLSSDAGHGSVPSSVGGAAAGLEHGGGAAGSLLLQASSSAAAAQQHPQQQQLAPGSGCGAATDARPQHPLHAQLSPAPSPLSSPSPSPSPQPGARPQSAGRPPLPTAAHVWASAAGTAAAALAAPQPMRAPSRAVARPNGGGADDAARSGAAFPLSAVREDEDASSAASGGSATSAGSRSGGADSGSAPSSGAASGGAHHRRQESDGSVAWAGGVGVWDDQLDASSGSEDEGGGGSEGGAGRRRRLTQHGSLQLIGNLARQGSLQLQSSLRRRTTGRGAAAGGGGGGGRATAGGAGAAAGAAAASGAAAGEVTTLQTAASLGARVVSGLLPAAGRRLLGLGGSDGAEAASHQQQQQHDAAAPLVEIRLVGGSHGDSGSAAMAAAAALSSAAADLSSYQDKAAAAAAAAAEAEAAREREEHEAAEALLRIVSQSAAGGLEVTIVLRPRRVGVLDASMQLLGLAREEARSCLALLGSGPGGVFLDVKSAYSKPRDLEQFAAVLRGVGVNVRAVCSFAPRQLAFPSAPGAPPPPFDALRFFHGINGLEAAAMRGSVPRGCRLLINGASLLLEEGETNDDQLLWGNPDSSGSGGDGAGGGGGAGGAHGGGAHHHPPGSGNGRVSAGGRPQRPPSWAGAGSAWGLAGGSLVCELSWMRLRALVDSLDLVCGIYVQERDASTASVQALVQLVNDNPAYLPLGFAYGHVRDRVLPFINVGGRGYAGQELMEEFQAKQDLAREAKAMIDEGRHRSAGRQFVVACGRRLIGAGRWLLSSSNQRTFLHLLADYDSPGGAADLLRVVDECGGVRHVIYRFFRHYDVSTARWAQRRWKSCGRLICTAHPQMPAFPPPPPQQQQRQTTSNADKFHQRPHNANTTQTDQTTGLLVAHAARAGLQLRPHQGAAAPAAQPRRARRAAGP